MRARSSFVAASIFATFSIMAVSAMADDTSERNSNLPQLPAATASAPAPTTAPAPTIDSSSRVVVVQTANGPQAFQLAPEKKTKRVWYGWQTLTLDGAAIASGVILAEGHFDAAGWVWIGTYAFGPPVVHALHGRIGMAFADLGLRVGAPALTTLIGAAVGCSGSSNNNGDDGLGNVAACATGIVLGFMVGYAGAIAVDAAVLARENVAVDPDADDAKEIRKQEARRASKPSIMPDFGVGQNRATFGLHGQF